MTNHNQSQSRKVVVVGAGDVGSSFAYALAQRGIAEEIAMIDRNQELMKGQVLDLVHGAPYYPTVKIYNGDKTDYADARVIVITAGAKQNPGESRLELLKKNVNIIERIVSEIIEQESTAMLVIVSNPVDVLTYFACKKSGWPRERVIGSGTVLDSARLRYLISDHCNVDVKNVHAYIIGEHGDSEFAAWSMCHIGGMPLQEFLRLRGEDNKIEENKITIEQKVRDSAYHIIGYKGATYYAVGLALVKITEAILLNERSILSISMYLQGEYGISDVCMGVPCLVSARGAEEIIEKKLPSKEQKALERSAGILKKAIQEVGNYQ
jgi:L-lactate dehydrogenase